MAQLKTLALLLISISSFAQYNSLGFGLGSSVFRGETSHPLKLIEEPGLNLYGLYSYWLPNDERWQISTKVHLDYINGKRQSLSSDGAETYNAHSFLLSTLFGMRFYLDNDIRDYVPEKNQGAFFVGLFAGPSLAYSKYITPSIIDPADDTYNLNPILSFNMMGEVGYRLFINEFWAYELSLGFQSGFNDRWDGIKGGTGIPDYIFQASFGLTYSFYQFDLR